jgi:prepilin-type N-terminal cleavage/methylation domain-containing protein
MTIHDNKTALKSQAGFTLVELAIVMIIIGLLIGGVLKGQQLITNAQITATVAQIKAIDAATTSFRDNYAGMAGDLITPATRLANCTAANNCNIPGNGDGKVDTAAGAGIDFSAAAGGEQLAYWSQLNAAGLLTGINPSAANTFWGGNYPASKLAGGGFDIGWFAGNALLSNQVGGTAANVPTGHFLALHGTANAAVGAGAPDAFMTANQAARIDTKIDDGVPGTGTVQAAGAAACILAGPPPAYNEAVAGALCSLFIQFQN